MHSSIMDFGKRVLNRDMIEGKIILNIGALNINGSWEGIIRSFNPKFYIGTDMQGGDGVDLIAKAENLDRIYPSIFDLIISTEVIEHIEPWNKAIDNMKFLLKVGGVLIITTRSKGFHYHPYPHDYWRYDLSDMENIFSDFDILILEEDPEAPGVMMLARKISEKQKCLDNIKLFKVDKNYKKL